MTSLKNEDENRLKGTREGIEEKYVQRPGSLIKLTLLKAFIIVVNCWRKQV